MARSCDKVAGSAGLGEELRVEDNSALLQVCNPVPEWNERALAVLTLDFEEIAGTVILDCNDGPDWSAILVDCSKTDQVGVVIFTLFKRWQCCTINFDQGTAKGFGFVPLANTLEADNCGAARFPRLEQSSPHAPNIEVFVLLQIVDAAREELEPDLSANPMCARDRSESDRALAAVVRGHA
jgi:hypothetical protein